MTYALSDGRVARRQGLLIATADGFAADWVKTWGDSTGGFRTHGDPVAGAPLNLRLARDDVSLQGRLLNPDGSPLAEARVRITGVMIPQRHDLTAHLARETQFTVFNSTDYETELYDPHLLPGLVVETRTDAAGRFQLSGIGRDRLVRLHVSAPSVVDTDFVVMTRDAPDVRTRLGEPKIPLASQPIIYGARFTLQLQPGRTVKGRVIDRDSRQPVAGMWVGPRQNAVNEVTASLYPWVTDDAGRFTIYGLSPDVSQHEIAAIATPGLPYLSASTMADGNAEVVIESSRGIPFRLKLVDEQNRPVDAEVSYTDIQPNPHLARSRAEYHWPVNLAAKRGAGTYEGFVLPGPGAVLVKLPQGTNYRPARVDPKAFFAPGRTRWNAEEQKSEYGTLHELVVSEGIYRDTYYRGDRIAQKDYAAIVLVNPPQDSGPLDLSANVMLNPARGGGPPSRDHSDEEQAAVRRDADPGNENDIIIDPNGEIVGILLDEAGKPVADATIACGAVLTDSGQLGEARSITDAQGKYRLAAPVPGVYVVWLEKSGNAEMTAAADDGLLVEAGKIAASRLTLRKGTPVAGVVVNEQDQPVPGATVYCYSTARPPAAPRGMTAKSDDQGRFQFLVTPGRVLLIAASSDQILSSDTLRVEKNLTVPPRDRFDASQPPLRLKLVRRDMKFGDPAWVASSTPLTQVVAQAQRDDVTGTVVDERGLPVRDVKVFMLGGGLAVTGESGEFRFPSQTGTQIPLYAFAPGYHLWFGRPASGDELRIGLEQAEPMPAPRAARPNNPVVLPTTVAEFEKLLQANTARLATGRLELSFDYEWRRPTNDNPQRTVTTRGTLQRLRQGTWLRMEFDRQIPNPAPQDDKTWSDQWVTGVDGDLEYAWRPATKSLAYGELHPESRQVAYWDRPLSAPPVTNSPSKLQIERELQEGHNVWNVRVEYPDRKMVIQYFGVRPDRGYLPSRIEVSSNNQLDSRTEYQDFFEPAPGVWVAKTLVLEAFFLDRPAKRSGYTANRTKVTITRLELGEAAGLKEADFVFNPPKDAVVKKWSPTEQRVMPPGIRPVTLQFLGGEKQVPLAGLQVEFTNGYGDRRKSMGQFTTDAQGQVQALLPLAFYAIHLTATQELPYLPIEKLWDGQPRGPRPDLSLYVTRQGGEKWLAGKRRDDTAEAAGGARRLIYRLLPACELVLRAVDAETGNGLPGAEFYTENAVGEDWAHPIYAENLGSPFAHDPPDESRQAAWRSDKDGNFRRFVSANAGFTYGVTKAPAGYQAADSAAEVEVPIVYGQRRAEHVFRFKRVTGPPPQVQPM
ncbi:MAG: carboxypeptidase regulatory-like domain-containing protein [Planctomycetes bacterium]|nr:carboxypeptidase regulatory-like domain-containing protein [Planctomycetota bacterium]